LGSYTWWGLAPIYWKLLDGVAPIDTAGHRTVWTLLSLAVVHTVRGSWPSVRRSARSSKNRRTVVLTGALLSVNWLTFLYAVDADRVVEASLGYFINPLVSVVLGVIILGERLRPIQWMAVALAASGVAWLWVQVGAVPWVALTLAGTFGLYGLLRKTADFDSLDGLTMESTLMAGPWVLVLAWRWNDTAPVFGSGSLLDLLLIAGTGVVTAVPLLLFAAGARRVPLSAMGLFQYLAPTLQLLLGLFAFGESLSGDRLVGYCLIWIALLVVGIEGFTVDRKRPAKLGS